MFLGGSKGNIGKKRIKFQDFQNHSKETLKVKMKITFKNMHDKIGYKDVNVKCTFSLFYHRGADKFCKIKLFHGFVRKNTNICLIGDLK